MSRPPPELQDLGLACLQCRAEERAIANNPLTGSALRSNFARSWFDPEMNWDALPKGRRGRQRTYSDAAIQTCLSMKALFGMALRQTTGLVESLLRLVGLACAVSDFSTLSRRQKTLAVNIPCREPKDPPHLLIDSTGIKVEGEGEWHARRHDGPKRRVWRKIHLGIEKEKLEIRAVQCPAGELQGKSAERGDHREPHRPLSAASCGCACGQWMERIPPPEPRRDETSGDHAPHDPAGQWMHCM